MAKPKTKNKPSSLIEPLRQIRAGAVPLPHQIKTGGAPEKEQESTNSLTPNWQFRTLDLGHPNWGWKNLFPKNWREVLEHLQAFEGMSWNDIQSQAGGRGRGGGTNSHYLPVEGFCKDAQSRLAELGHEEIEQVFSLRLTNTLRLYGIREGRTLRIVWRDGHHGTKLGCYPTK